MMTDSPRVTTGQGPVVMVIHGPNLNLLGEREPEVYGTQTLQALNTELGHLGETLGVRVDAYQTNCEGHCIDLLHRAREGYGGVIINPAAYAHTSVAILDGIRCLTVPVVEVHLSNVHAREPYRHRSLTAAACLGVIAGLGSDSYFLALRHIATRLARIYNPPKRLPAAPASHSLMEPE